MWHALKKAFPHTIPVMLGYLSIGVAYGLLLQNAGYGLIWAVLMSLVVYSGAMQFIVIDFLTGTLGLLEIAVVSLVVNVRHMFYGLSLLTRFRPMGKLKPYMIFSLTDETYSLLCSVKTPEDTDHRLFLFFIALLNQCYWIVGSAAGAALGSVLTFDTTGMDFAMTALFVVIFVDQWKSFATHLPALIGLGSAAAALVLFGADDMVIPAMLLITALLLAFRRPIEPGLPRENETEPSNPLEPEAEQEWEENAK